MLRLATASFIVLLVTGTPAGLTAQAGPVSGSVNVFAAASLTDAFAAIGDAFERHTPTST